MSTSTGLRIVTPQEALTYQKAEGLAFPIADLAYTVATEPDRTRAAVVKALRARPGMFYTADLERADAIENGADW